MQVVKQEEAINSRGKTGVICHHHLWLPVNLEESELNQPPLAKLCGASKMQG